MTSLLDAINPADGVLTLREAINASNLNAEPDAITFRPGLSGTISLTNGPMTIINPLSINGNEAENIVIDARQVSRIFDITAGAGDVSLAGFTLTNGRTTGIGEKGGAIRFLSSGTLRLNRSTLSGTPQRTPAAMAEPSTRARAR